jgi:hypothetical protein
MQRLQGRETSVVIANDINYHSNNFIRIEMMVTHKERLRYYLKQNYRFLWRWDIVPISFRRYAEAVRGGYLSAIARFPKHEDVEEWRRIVGLIETRVRPRVREFYERLSELRETKITDKNILEIKQKLLDLKRDEYSYVEHFRRYIVATLPERERFLSRLEWYRERFSTIIEGLERLIEEEKVVIIKPYIAESETPKWFKHFADDLKDITTGTIPRREMQGEERQLTLAQIFRMTKEDWEEMKKIVKEEFAEWLVRKTEESLLTREEKEKGIRKPLRGREKVIKTLSEAVKIKEEEDVEKYLRGKKE